MKNFPHQFNDLQKLLTALQIAKGLVDGGVPLTDETFGERLTRAGVYTYRSKSLSVDQFLQAEKQKPKESRGYLTVARDIRRFLELLGCIIVLDDQKRSRITTVGKQILTATSDEQLKELWKNALMQLSLEGTDGEISHPYRILLRIVNACPGIETPKLMLALEAENDSEEEFERIIALSELPLPEIIRETGTSASMAANAVKILPGMADQLNDIERTSNKAYPIGHIVVTEDEIVAGKEPRVLPRDRATFREVTSDDIAKEPSINIVSSASIDLSDAIRKRQKRLTEHQEIVRLLAVLNEQCEFQLFEGKFDCLGIKGDTALLYEVKTILERATDQERQTIKGVGQLKYYKFSIVGQEMHVSNIKEILVFSRKPGHQMIQFCTAEKIAVIWREGSAFQICNIQTGKEDRFDPGKLVPT